MSDIIEEMDIPLKDSDKSLLEFNKGNYISCRKILQEMLADDENKNQVLQTNRTLNDCILKNNVVVCKALEMLSEDTTAEFKLLKLDLQKELLILNSIPEICVDANLAFVFNYLSLFFIQTAGEGDKVMDFEQQLASILRNLCRVLDGGTAKSRLEQIQLAFKLGYLTFEQLDTRQALLITAIRVLVATAAQDEFVLKITLKSRDNISLPMEMLHADFDRTDHIPILLLPMLHGQALALSDISTKQVMSSLNLALAALLVRLCKLKPALSCVHINHESLKLRALSIYIKAYTQSQCNLKIDALKLLETLFAMKEGREGELGCRARILQAKLVSQSGKQQQAVNILRQATKSHGSKWILLDALANMYLQLNQEEAYLKTLELLLQCLLTEETKVPALFEERILKTLHQNETPSVCETLYKMANLLIKLKRYEAASERMLQLLARQDDAAISEDMGVSLRSLVRETALVLLQAGKLNEARVVCHRAASSNMLAQSDKNATDWLNKLTLDVTALMLMACIHEAAHKWDEALQALDRCVQELHAVKPADIHLHTCLLTRSLLQTVHIYCALDDAANTKHAFRKALSVSKDREILLLYSRYLLDRGENEETLQLWFSHEKHYPKCDIINNADAVLSFLLAPKLSDTQKSDIENEIKKLIIKSRK